MFNLFHREPDPKELVRKWQSNLRAEQRHLDRSIRDIKFEMKKVEKSIKEAAKRNDMGSVRALAKEMVNSKKAVTRLYTNKAHLTSVGLALNEQLAMVKVAGALGKSTAVMKEMNNLMKVPDMQHTMMEMSKEMMKAGLIDEMMNDALDSVLDSETMEEEAEAEVDKVLAELALEDFLSMPAAVKAQKAKMAAAAQEEEDMEGEIEGPLAQR